MHIEFSGYFSYQQLQDDLFIGTLPPKVKSLGQWAVATFECGSIPMNIKKNYRDYRALQKYLEDRKEYRSNKTFLKDAFDIISRDEFNLRGSEGQNYLKVYWVIDTFQLKEIPENIRWNWQDYKKFKKYVESKGDYNPSKEFLKHVFQMISEGKFFQCFNNELQSVETTMAFHDGSFSLFRGRCAVSSGQTQGMLNKCKENGLNVSVTSAGITNLNNLKLNPIKSESPVTSLEAICCSALLKNGYPQAFISSDAFSKKREEGIKINDTTL